jgi:small nuclear ribonucleoprotein G
MPQAQPELKKVSPSAKFKLPLPDLKKYLEKRILVNMNGSRKVMGILRGYDVYLNVVLDDALEEKPGGEKVRIGMVVIRGNAVVLIEVRELSMLLSNSTDLFAGSRPHQPGRTQDWTIETERIP